MFLLKEKLEFSINKKITTPLKILSVAQKNILVIKQELRLFEDEGIRRKYLELNYNYLFIIPPASVESDSLFSSW